MHPSPIPPRVVTGLLAAALVLPIAICVAGGVAAMLAALGDAGGAAVLGRVALGLGMFWAVDLICLLLALAVAAGGDDDREP